jgi:hypothetical protein
MSANVKKSKKTTISVICTFETPNYDKAEYTLSVNDNIDEEDLMTYIFGSLTKSQIDKLNKLFVNTTTQLNCIKQNMKMYLFEDLDNCPTARKWFNFKNKYLIQMY